MAQKWVTEDELNYMKMGGKVVYAQQGATAQGGDDQVMQLIQAYAEAAKVNPQDLIAQLKQMSPEDQQQAIQNMAQELQNGAEGQEQNQSPQEEQAEMQGGGQDQMMQQIAQAIQQGADPQQVMAALVKQGVPEEQAGQMIQAIAQQMQGAPQMAKGGMVDPEKAKQILKDGTIYGKSLTDKQRKFFGAMVNKSEDGRTIVNFDSAATTQTAPIYRNPQFKNSGTVDGENTKYPFKQQAGGTAFYDEYRQDATQKLIQGGNLHTYEGKNIKAKGGYVEPHGYNIDVPGPELMGRRKDYLMDGNYEYGKSVSQGYHMMPSGRLMSNEEHKPNGNVGKQDLRRFMTGNVSIQGGQGAKYQTGGLVPGGMLVGDKQYYPYGGYVEYNSEGGAPSQVGNRAEWLSRFGSVYPVKAYGGYNARTNPTTPYTDFPSNEIKTSYDFSKTTSKDPFIQSPLGDASANLANTGSQKPNTQLTNNIGQTTPTTAKTSDVQTADAKTTSTLPQVPIAEGAQDLASQMPTGKSISANATKGQRAMGNLEAAGVMSGMTGGPLGMGLNAAGGAMDATANMMASMGKEGSGAQAFGKGASEAMGVAGQITAPFKDIPVVGQALDVAGKVLGFLIGGPLEKRSADIRKEENKKAEKYADWAVKNQPSMVASQGQYMAKYGKNVRNMKQRIMDDIYTDFDKYMKK